MPIEMGGRFVSFNGSINVRINCGRNFYRLVFSFSLFSQFLVTELKTGNMLNQKENYQKFISKLFLLCKKDINDSTANMGIFLNVRFLTA